MKQLLIAIIFLLNLLLQLLNISAQELTLDDCINAAIEKNKQQKNTKLIEQKNDLEQYNLLSNYYPQLTLEASASYQSDVMALPIKLPNLNLPTIPNENYQLTAQVQQLIWDGGSVSAASNSKELENVLQKTSIEITTQQLKETTSSLFFGALLLQEKLLILQENIEFLESKEAQLQSLYKNGVIVKSNLLALQIEIEKLKQELNATSYDLQSLKNTLANYLEIPDLSSMTLKNPNMKSNSNVSIKRAELKAIEQKNDLLESGKESVSSQLMPKIAAFAKVGYGNPNPMNVFEEGAQTYYMAGINLKWQPFDWFKSSKTKEVIEINKAMNNNDKHELERNLNNIVITENMNIKKYDELLSQDESIIDMQGKILDMTFSQLANGTITSTEYIVEVKKMTDSKINKSVHNIQKQMAISNLLIKTGNK